MWTPFRRRVSMRPEGMVLVMPWSLSPGSRRSAKSHGRPPRRVRHPGHALHDNLKAVAGSLSPRANTPCAPARVSLNLKFEGASTFLFVLSTFQKVLSTFHDVFST